MNFVSCCAVLMALLATFVAQTSFAQSGGALRGTVVDETNLPVIGASVVVKGSTKGVTTDINGVFNITGLKSGDVLEVSFLGYETKEVPYNNQTNLTITLSEASTMADAVVVTALGIKRSEKALSYNVQQVEADELTTVKDANFMNTLVGKVAGVQINSAANGAGGPTRVVMRGVKSLTGSNSALYVIDGVPMFNITSGANNSGGAAELNGSGQPSTESIADINPEDIESISVLNGPAAAALYGSSAANGVVLITTKKGTEGSVKVTFSNNTTFSTPFRMPQFQTTYGNRRNEFGSWGEKGTALAYDPADFFKTGTNVSNAVTLSIGNQKNQTYFSAAANNSDAIIPNSKYNRYNFTVRNTTKFLKDKMTFDFGASYILQNQLNPVAAGGFANPIPIVYLWPRGEDFDEVRVFEEWSPERNIYVQRWPWGADCAGSDYAENPYWEMYRKLRESSKNRYMFNVGLSYEILDWLSISGRLSLDDNVGKSESKVYATSVAKNIQDINGTGYYSFSSEKYRTLYGDALVNINKSWGKWSLSANIGSSFNHQSYETNSYSGVLGFIPNLFTYSNIYKDYSGAGFDAWRQREYAVFGNVEVGALNAIYLTLTARNEWSSTLSNTSQLSYFFPSVGISAVISELVDMPKWFNYLKLRASFADVGSPLQRSLTEDYYIWTGSAASKPGHRPVTHLYPEKTDSWEFGVTARFLQHLSLDLTLYRSDTKKQTIPVSLSTASGGYSTMYIQSGNVRNQGLELAIGYDNQWKSGFGWSTNFTYSTNRNRIVALFSKYWDPVTNKTYYPNDVNIKSGNNPINVGGSMGDIYVSNDFVRDLEGNIYVSPEGTVSVYTLPEAKKIGSTLPKGNIGWTNTFTYKGLSLNVLFTARIGGLATSYTQMFMDRYGVSKTSADARDKGGVFINNGYIDAESYYSLTANVNGGLLQEYVYDATNVRLQELSLAYTLPNKWFKNKVRMTASVIGRNLWLIYCKCPFDPEMTFSTGTYNQNLDYFMMPSLRNIGFSIKLEF